ncbi:MAG: hypothetical protein NXI22_09555, partial [bacterium]|nr:hypothetical protein [bacterium]
KEDEEEKKKKKEEPKKDFEVGALRTLPSAENRTARQVKPGHWTTASQQIVANNFSVQSTLTSATTDSAGKEIRVEKTRFATLSQRPASLPKGEARSFESLYYVPRRLTDTSKTVSLQSTFQTRNGGRQIAGGRQPAANLKEHQYFFVVLAGNPDAYAFVDNLDAMQFHNEDGVDIDFSFYQVLRPKIEKRVPIPSNPLTWTSIAYVLWDDVQPNQLTLDQQTALLDWLHFGGQLIVSGPRSIDSLRGSFLNDYLPADAIETEELAPERFREMSDYWTLAEKNYADGRPMAILPDKPPLGANLSLRPGGSWIQHTGDLVAEKQVGRGRVVMTRFALSSRQIRSWPHFDGFFHTCLMRKPGRRFYEVTDMLTGKMEFNERAPQTLDPRMSTMVRYFTRDVDHLDGKGPTYNVTNLRSLDGLGDLPDDFNDAQPSFQPFQPGEGGVVAERIAPSSINRAEEAAETDPHYGGYRPSPLGGMASWNDFSGPSEAARKSLKDAAGISVPDSTFVLQMLAIYLAVLVPVNWAFFRLIGRVEWAWIAAPIIAILGAVAVVRFAQLDIGFARSQTEVAVLETYSGYDRAHLTRYTALYTSLTTRYNIVFDEDGALALPFSVNAAADTSGGYTEEVNYVRDKDTKLSGFDVASNTTGMMHSEEMLPLGGQIALNNAAAEGAEITNSTTLSLRGVGVISRADGRWRRAWIGRLAPGEKRVIQFEDITPEAIVFPQWKDDSVMYSFESQVDDLLALLPSANDEGRSNSVEVSREAIQELKVDLFPARDALLEQFDHSDLDNSETLNREELIRCCRLNRAGELGLGPIVDLAVKKLRLNNGESRLIGWTEQPIEDVVFRPLAPQKMQRTLVLAHLHRPMLAAPETDSNHRSDVFKNKLRETAEDPNLFSDGEEPTEVPEF